MTLSIAQIKEKLQHSDQLDKALMETLRRDSRKGVQALVKKYENDKEKRQELEWMHERMIEHEQALREEGFSLIAGIDEVGRGPLAGPVVAAAVILPKTFKLLGLTDSKKLSKQKREQFAEIIKKEAVAYSIQFISAAEVDRLNIYEATRQAMAGAVQNLLQQPDVLLVDAMNVPVSIKQRSIVKGDARSLSIAASSVLAKVARDQYMEELDGLYPGYRFCDHVGYGTKAHLEALEKLGLTPEHRRSFRPVSELGK